MKKLDSKDMKILGFLSDNAKLTSQQISRKTLIPITTVHNRIKKLEKRGVIKGYTTVLDHKKLGKGILAFILVTVSYITSSGKRISQAELAKKIRSFPCVEEIHIVTGGADLIMKARVSDMEELNDFVINELRNIDGVENTQTIISLSSPEL